MEAHRPTLVMGQSVEMNTDVVVQSVDAVTGELIAKFGEGQSKIPPSVADTQWYPVPYSLVLYIQVGVLSVVLRGRAGMLDVAL